MSGELRFRCSVGRGDLEAVVRPEIKVLALKEQLGLDPRTAISLQAVLPEGVPEAERVVLTEKYNQQTIADVMRAHNLEHYMGTAAEWVTAEVNSIGVGLKYIG